MSKRMNLLLPALAVFLSFIPSPGRALEIDWQGTVDRLGADSFEDREAAEARLREALAAIEKAGTPAALGDAIREIERAVTASGEEGVRIAARRVVASFRPGGCLWRTEPESVPGQLVSLEFTPKGILAAGTDEGAGWLALHDAKNGKLLWRRSTSNVENIANLLAGGMTIPPPAVSGETVFVRGTRPGRDHVDAFRLADGIPLWSQAVPAGSSFTGIAREGVIAAGWIAVEAPPGPFTKPKPAGSAVQGGIWMRLLDPRDGRTVWAKEFPHAALGGIPGEFRISADGATVLAWEGITMALIGEKSAGLPLAAVRTRDGSLAWREERLPGGATASGRGPGGVIVLGGLQSSDFVEMSGKLGGMANAPEDILNAAAWIAAYDPASGRKTLSLTLPVRETPAFFVSGADGVIAVTTILDEMAADRCRMRRLGADGKTAWDLPLKGFDGIRQVWETPEGFFVLGADEGGALRIELRSFSDGSRLSTIDLPDLTGVGAVSPVPGGILLGMSDEAEAGIALYRTADPAREKRE